MREAFLSSSVASLLPLARLLDPLIMVFDMRPDRPIVEGGLGNTGGILLLNAGPYLMVPPPLDVVYPFVGRRSTLLRDERLGTSLLLP
jgi:hypothetical protein